MFFEKNVINVKYTFHFSQSKNNIFEPNLNELSLQSHIPTEMYLLTLEMHQNTLAASLCDFPL